MLPPLAVESLLDQMAAFSEGFEALLAGSSWIGNVMFPDVCLLYASSHVSYNYEEGLLPELRKVIYRLALTSSDWVIIDKKALGLLDSLGDTNALLQAVEDTSCAEE